jgi:RND family efflux transporter MFP subunit
MNRFRVFLIGVVVVALAGCGSRPAAPAGGKPAGKSSAQRDIPVIVETVSQQDLQDFIVITGTLEGETDVVMSSETSGTVVELHKHLSDWVDAGEEMGRVDNEEYALLLQKAQAAALAAEAAFEAASMNWKTSQKLAEVQTISEADFAQAKSAYKQAQANLDAARAGAKQAQRSYDNSRFVAPVSGFIAHMGLEVGEHVNMGAPVCTIVNTRRMVVKSGLSERDVRKVHRGDVVQLRYENDLFAGTITGVGKKPLSGTLLYPVEISLNNHDELLFPGMAVSIEIDTRVYEQVIAISQNVIQKQYDTDYVYVVSNITEGRGKAEKRIITRVMDIGERSIIATGIQAGDLLVTEGAENLEDGMMVVMRQSNTL